MPKPRTRSPAPRSTTLALTSMGTNLFAAEQAKNGDIKGMFFYNSTGRRLFEHGTWLTRRGWTS
ncbi:MAG: hypothetical protein ACLSVD_10935 [Eggerthellaceae bacterium]